MPQVAVAWIWMVIAGFAILPAAVDASSEDQVVRGVVESFLTRLGDRQYDTLASDFTPKAIIVVTRQRDGQWTNSYQTAEEWIETLKRNPNPVAFREPIANLQVRPELRWDHADKDVYNGIRDQFTAGLGVAYLY